MTPLTDRRVRYANRLSNARDFPAHGQSFLECFHGLDVSMANIHAQAPLTTAGRRLGHNPCVTKTNQTVIHVDDPVAASGLRAMGARLREAMEARGLTAQHVADYVGVTDGAVRQWWGGFQNVRLSNLIGAAEAVNVSLDWLLLGGGNMDSIDSKVRRVPDVIRPALIAEINDLILRKQTEARQKLPPEVLQGHLIADKDIRLKAWSAKGKPKAKLPRRKARK